MKKDWRERELTIEVIVGVFMVMILLGLGYFTIILSKEAWFTEKTVMRVTFANVMGLRSGDSVVVRGMPVGKVSALELLEPSDGVCVTLMLDHPVEMRSDYTIKVVATSMLGGRQLQINEGSPGADLVELDLYEGRTPFDLMDGAAEIVNAVREGIIEGGVIDNIRSASEEIKNMVARVGAGEGFLGRVLSDDNKLYEDLAAGVSSLKTITARLEEGEGTLGQLLSEDDAIYRDLAAAVASLKTITSRLEEGKGTLGRLLSEEDTVYRDLSDTIASLKGVVSSIENAEGTVGRLIKDDSLYTKVEEILDEARATIDDLRETAPVTTFSSIFFGAF